MAVVVGGWLMAAAAVAAEPGTPTAMSSAAPAKGTALADRFYFLAGLGPSFLEDTHLTGYDDYESGSIQFDPGVRLDLALGYRFWRGFSVEAETGFLFNLTQLRGVGLWSADAGLYQEPLLVSVRWEARNWGRWRPFLGLGGGGVISTLEDYDWAGGTSDSDVGWAWQGMAGCGYALTESLELGLTYKYLGTTERMFERLEARIDGTHSHAVQVMLRMRF
jgi:opacity protein-like surface antigen